MKTGRIWLDRPISWGCAHIIATFHIWSLDISRAQATLILSLVTQRPMHHPQHSLNLERNNTCEHQLFSEFGWKCHPQGSRASKGERTARRAKSRTSLTFLDGPSRQLGCVELEVLCRAPVSGPSVGIPCWFYLEAPRTTGSQGRLSNLSPKWVRSFLTRRGEVAMECLSSSVWVDWEDVQPLQAFIILIN